MTTIYLVRHAQAEGNLYRRAQGWYDGRVTETGKRQIAALEQRFRDIPVDAAYASDLRRTQATAQAVVRPQNLPLNIDPTLKEIGMGIYEDCTFGELRFHHPEESRLFFRCAPEWAPEGGETFAQVQERMVNALFRIGREHPDQTVAVFTHSTAIRCLLAALRGKHPSEALELGLCENTAVTCIEVEGDRFRILFEGDASHLPEELATQAQQQRRAEAGPTPQVWFRETDLKKEEKFYTEARKEAWLSVYGSLEGYQGRGFLNEAKDGCRLDPRALQTAMADDVPVGLLQFAPLRFAAERVGYLPFLYVKEEFRCQGIGVQLLGQAVSLYRSMGRRCLRLCCAPDNLPAQRFYRHYGFYPIGTSAGARQPLDLLEKGI